MSGKDLALLNAQVPAYLQQEKLQALAKQANAIAVGGIGGGTFPRISIRGGRFHAIVDGEENTIGNVDPVTGVFQPLTQLTVVIIAGNPNLSKMYYDKNYDPNATDQAPKCYSNNGIVPSPRAEAPQSPSCATCPHNVWGSKITPTGSKTKMCADSKRVALLAGDDLEGDIYGMNIPAASLKPLREFINKLDDRGLPITAVKTVLTFDPTASFPLLMFHFGGFLEQSEFATVVKRCKEDEVRVIIGTEEQAVPVTAQAPAAPSAPAAAPQQPGAPAVPTVPGFGGNGAVPTAPAAAPVPPPVVTPPTAAPQQDVETKGFKKGRKKKAKQEPEQAAAPTPPPAPAAAAPAPAAPQAAAQQPVEQELDDLLKGLNFD